jgi:hypothetical protein
MKMDGERQIGLYICAISIGSLKPSIDRKPHSLIYNPRLKKDMGVEPE